MRKLRMFLLPVVLGALLVGPLAPSASADEVAVVAFQGQANVTPGLKLPGLQPNTNADWDFADTTCAAASVGKKGTPATDLACNIDGAGKLGPQVSVAGNPGFGHCGLSTGKGDGNAQAFGHDYSWTIAPHWVSVGGVLLIPGTVNKETGTTGSGDFVSVVNASPNDSDPENGVVSCVTDPAGSFDVTGLAAFVITN